MVLEREIGHALSLALLSRSRISAAVPGPRLDTGDPCDGCGEAAEGLVAVVRRGSVGNDAGRYSRIHRFCGSTSGRSSHFMDPLGLVATTVGLALMAIGMGTLVSSMRRSFCGAWA